MQNRFTRLFGIVAVALVSATAATTTQAMETIYGVTSDAKLIVFEAQDPSIIKSSKDITGLQLSETLYGLDFRPQTGELYAVGSTTRVYTIDPDSGAATIAGDDTFALDAEANLAGVDFDPIDDKLRFVSNDEDNVTLATDDSAPAVGSDITPDGDIVSIAHSNSYPGATSTVLYGIDIASNNLVSISGNTASVVGGGLGWDIEANSAIDFHGSTLWAVLNSGGVSRLHVIDPSTGAASAALGILGGGHLLTGIAVAPDSLQTFNKKKGYAQPSVTITLNFAKPGLADSIKIKGTIDVPEGFNPAGQVVTIDVGGVSKTFTLDAKGKAKVGSDSFSIGKPKLTVVDGVTTAVSKLSLMARAGNFAPELVDEGLTNDLEPGKNVNVPVSLSMNGHFHQIMTSLFYSAALDKKGKASTPK